MSKDIKKSLEILNNPHPIKLNESVTPTQLAFQHYQNKKTRSNKTGELNRYLKLAEDDIVQHQLKQRDKTNQHARLIAEQLHPTEKIHNELTTDVIDTVTVDIPLLIRLLEYAREDAKTDMDLHNVANNMIKLSKKLDVLDMSCYRKIAPKNKKEL